MNLTELNKSLSMHKPELQVGPNAIGKDYFTGDISGQYKELRKALKKAGFNPAQDRLFTTGNLIDYGNDNFAMLDLLNQPWFFSVVGIHELLMRNAIESGHYLYWHTHGGEWAFDSKMRLLPEVKTYIKRIAKLPLAITLEHKRHGRFGVISAGPGGMTDWGQLSELTPQQRLDCLMDDELPAHKHRPVTGVDCLLVGNLSARHLWSRGNIVGTNLGARFLPNRGQLKVWKTKKLLKAVENKALFQSL